MKMINDIFLQRFYSIYRRKKNTTAGTRVFFSNGMPKHGNFLISINSIIATLFIGIMKGHKKKKK